jgi:hypothetical protein
VSFPKLRRMPLRPFGASTLIIGLLAGIAGIASITTATATPGGPGALATIVDGNLFDGADGVKDDFAGTALPDRPTAATDNSYTPGAKEDDPCPRVETGSIPSHNPDLTRFYVATWQGNRDTFLYLAWERASTDGTIVLDFELNQSHAIKSAGDGCNGVNPTRTTGDKLVTYDLQSRKDEETVVVSVRTWGRREWGRPTVLDSAAAVGSIAKGLLFGEMAISLEESGIFTARKCDTFASVFVKSRSPSVYSELKDLIAPVPKHIGDCGIALDKSVNSGDHATLEEALAVYSLDNLSYTVVITNVGHIPLKIIVLSDSLYPAFPASCSQAIGSRLTGGASFTCNYLAAAGDHHNVAAVTAVDVTDKRFSAEDGTYVDMIEP